MEQKVKRMFYFNELWVCSEYDSLAFAYNEGRNEYELLAGHSGLPSDDLNTWEFMLHTGLKDKTGREAYFKDIAVDNAGNPIIIVWDYPLLARLQEIEFKIIGP